jgi:uncharacterized protein (TIGR02145 family)
LEQRKKNVYEEAYMRKTNALLAGLVAASASMATISGKITDASGTAILGALVQLETGGQNAITGTDGKFTLISNAIISRKSNLPPLHSFFAVINNGLLSVNIEKRSAIEITEFDLNGKVLSTIQRAIDAGTHSMALLQRSSGVYLYKVKSGNTELVLKSNSIDRISQRTAVSVQGPSTNNDLAKQTKVSAAINDVIAVTKSGYLNYREVVTNSDTSGIEIRMIVCAGTVTDTDGNVYQTVKIGNQEWTVENLRVTKFNDGSAITKITSNSTWDSCYYTDIPAYCYYNNTANADSIKKFGAHYNWYTVSAGKLAPTGWHVPSDADWMFLEYYLVSNGYNWDGTTNTNKIAKSLAAKTDWSTYSTTIGSIAYDLTKNNSSGFSALPGGYRLRDGSFNCIGIYGHWWSTTVYSASFAYYRNLGYVDSTLTRDIGSMSCGFSVRLLRD